MKHSPKLSLGVDISQTHLNLALLAKDEKGVRLVKGLQFPLPEGVVIHGAIKDPETLLAILKQIHKEHKLPGSATVGLMDGMSIHQIIELPKRLPTNIAEFVRAEFKQCVAIANEATVSGYSHIATTDEGNHRLLAVAADERRIMDLIELYRYSKVKAQDIEPPILAMLRALYSSRVENHLDKHNLIVWCRDHTLHVCVCRRGQLDFVHVRNMNDLQDNPESMYETMIHELKATMQYYSLEVLDETPIWNITVVSDPNWVWPDEIFDSLKKTFPSQDLELLFENDGASLGISGFDDNNSTSMVALGLAQRGFDNTIHLPAISMLPSRVVQIRVLQRQAILAGLATIIGGGLMTLVVMFLSWHANYTQNHISTYMAEHDVNETVLLIDRHRELEEQIETMEAQNALVDEIIQMHTAIDWTPFLTDIATMTTAKLKIKYLEQPRDEEHIILEGVSVNRHEINQFVERLKKSKTVTDAQVVKREQIILDTKPVLAYQIKCQVAQATGGAL